MKRLILLLLLLIILFVFFSCSATYYDCIQYLENQGYKSIQTVPYYSYLS